jgi:hypothetical protein
MASATKAWRKASPAGRPGGQAMACCTAMKWPGRTVVPGRRAASSARDEASPASR